LIEVADIVEDGVVIPCASKSRIYAVKKCRHCLTVWNRDINAARNILGIFLSLRDKGELPLPFHPHISR
jgi:transposase